MLVFATLMAPALWLARGVSVGRALGLSALALGLGLTGSWVLDAPSGPCCALMLALLGLVSAWMRGNDLHS